MKNKTLKTSKSFFGSKSKTTAKPSDLSEHYGDPLFYNSLDDEREFYNLLNNQLETSYDSNNYED